MKPDPRLHHYCQNIKTGYLKDVIEMYSLLDFDIVYNPGEQAGWIMVGQKQLRFAIQITQVDDTPIADLDVKKRTHIAFLSDNPKEVVEKIRTWAETKGLEFRQGGWSDRELYFDLPDVFINFVVEVMHTSIEEE
ncbi:MAG: hypothetical protein KBD47_00560 [Candidatus Pacebacteria bacterium]|jgi:hypothetical protein|nr:hypothetical protein [Candidatus Paceibacterota bacterium]